MYCKNCGNDITNMKYCSKCGKAVEDIDVNIVTKPNTAVQNVKVNKSIKAMGYILAFEPLLILINYFIPSNMTQYLTIGVWILFFALWRLDKLLLKKSGYNGLWTWWGFVFTPVYLFLRAKKVDRKYSALIIFIILLLLVIALPYIHFQSAPQNYQTANDVIQQISDNIKENTYSAIGNSTVSNFESQVTNASDIGYPSVSASDVSNSDTETVKSNNSQKENTYYADYKWWEDYGKSYTSTLDSGAEYLTHEVQFVCNKNEIRNVVLYADENRDGSTHLEFYSVVDGENYLLLTADSFNTEYSTDFDVHSWKYKCTNYEGDEITILFIAEDKSLGVMSGYELFGVYGTGETPYNQMRSGTYYPVE